MKTRNITYLTTANYGYIDFLKSLVLNFKNLKILNEDRLIIYAMDDDTEKEMISFSKVNDINNIEVKKNDSGVKTFSNFGTYDFNRVTLKKLEIILNECIRNEIVHFVDADVFFFKNPKSEILKKIKDNDLCFQQDSPRSHNHDLYSNYVCTGNFTIKRSDKSLDFLRAVIATNSFFSRNDQELLYEYLNSKCKNIKEYEACDLDVYDPVLFQNGFDTFQGGFCKHEDKIAVHANHMEGKDAKMQNLKSIGAWME